MTIYKQLLEAAKPAGEFPGQTRVVDLHFALGLVDAGGENVTTGKDYFHCGGCEYIFIGKHNFPCGSCRHGSHFKKQGEEQ